MAYQRGADSAASRSTTLRKANRSGSGCARDVARSIRSGQLPRSRAEGGHPTGERSLELPHDRLRRFEPVHLLAEEGEPSDDLVGLVEEQWVVLEGGEDEDGASLGARGKRARERLPADVGRVVLQYVAHVARFVENQAARTGVGLDVVDRAPEVEQPWI